MKPHGCLWPLSIPYGVVVGIRNRLYDLEILTTQKVEAPVISVGNITVGGTGKTPFVIHLAERINRLTGNKRIKLGVISRGYGGMAKETHLVSDGKRLLSDFFMAGDEPVLIAQARTGAVVVVDKNRTRGARHAIENNRVKLLLLDDGYQHRKLHRDLDIVLLNAENPLGNRLVLPAGYLREPVKSLKRADLVVLSKAAGDEDDLLYRANRLEDLIKKPVIVTRMIPRQWRRLNQAEIYAPEVIAGKRVTAFAGIAHPRSFFNLVESLGANLVMALPMPDHCNYSKKFLDHISTHFLKSKSEWLVTTAKDAIKLPPLLRFMPLYYLETDMDVVIGNERLDKMLEDVIQMIK